MVRSTIFSAQGHKRRRVSIISFHDHLLSSAKAAEPRNFRRCEFRPLLNILKFSVICDVRCAPTDKACLDDVAAPHIGRAKWSKVQQIDAARCSNNAADISISIKQSHSCKYCVLRMHHLQVSTQTNTSGLYHKILLCATQPLRLVITGIVQLGLQRHQVPILNRTRTNRRSTIPLFTGTFTGHEIHAC
jgi:hypothetical protein